MSLNVGLTILLQWSPDCPHSTDGEIKAQGQGEVICPWSREPGGDSSQSEPESAPPSPSVRSQLVLLVPFHHCGLSAVARAQMTSQCCSGVLHQRRVWLLPSSQMLVVQLFHLLLTACVIWGKMSFHLFEPQRFVRVKLDEKCLLALSIKGDTIYKGPRTAPSKH